MLTDYWISMDNLSIYDFGRQLLDTGDLDPVYLALQGAKLEPTALKRWLLSYWCFYHSGTASWASDVREKDEGAYWSRMKTAAASKEYPRCHERRHFRGEKAVKATSWLADQGVDRLFDPLEDAAHEFTVEEVTDYVQTWPQFGPWIAFKAADMLERLGIARVKFSLESALYESPMKGANLLRQLEPTPIAGWPVTNGVGAGPWAVGRILHDLGVRKAPPRYERPINVQEAETILCKWHAYRGGHYRIGEDIEALRSGLLRFARCSVSQRLLRSVRAAKLGVANHG